MTPFSYRGKAGVDTSRYDPDLLALPRFERFLDRSKADELLRREAVDQRRIALQVAHASFDAHDAVPHPALGSVGNDLSIYQPDALGRDAMFLGLGENDDVEFHWSTPYKGAAAKRFALP